MFKSSIYLALFSASLAYVQARDVFAHYMALGPPPNGNYDDDFKTGHELGLDAFALNYGSGNGGDFNAWDDILQNCYDAAQRNGIKAFISFDMTTPGLGADKIVELSRRFNNHPAQYRDPGNGNLFISSFQNSEETGFQWPTDVIQPIGVPVSLYTGSTNHDPAIFDQTAVTGVFTWVHNELTTQQESDLTQSFHDASKSKNKPWMAAVASWFYKHYPTQNWGNNQDETIFVSRFQQLLKLQPDFLEILTWNDFGESHYIGQNDPEKKTGQDWATLDHSGFRGIAKNFIDAYKNDQTEVTVSSDNEQLYVFYRTQPWGNYGTNDPVLGGAPPAEPNFTPEGDNIYVVTFMASEGAFIHVYNGAETKNIAVPAGVHVTSVPFELGSVKVTMTRGTNEIANKSGGADIVVNHPVYNANVVCI